MTHKPKFAVSQTVYKWTGNYGGPGIVRGIANDTGQPLRYLVGHTIKDGYGEFYHVYAEGNLRDPEALTNQAAPNDNELLDALATAHRQVDMLLAMVIGFDKSFMPTQSSLWPDIVKRVELIQKYEATT